MKKFILSAVLASLSFACHTTAMAVDDVDVSEFFEDKSQAEIKNSRWKYRTTTNEVERTTNTTAVLTSTNAINLGALQGKNEHLYIGIGNQHNTGFYNDVIVIGYNNGLVRFCVDRCLMRARFDDEDAQTYELEEHNSHSYYISNNPSIYASSFNRKEYAGTTLNDSDYFLLKLHNAKKLVLNFPNMNGNSYTYRFDLKGLNTQKLGEK